MAQSYSDDTGTYVVPSAYTTYTVKKSFSGLASNGVLLLVGEADAGPDFTQEADLAANAFSPSEEDAVLAKYKSGDLVDAFRAAVAAANDEDIQGAFNQIVLLKTNVGAKASGALTNLASGTYGSLYDKSYGSMGNLIYFKVIQNTAESLPTTGSFAFIPAVGTVALNFRISGGAVVAPANIGAAASPASFVSTIDALSGVAASGGAARTVIPGVSGNLDVQVTSVSNKEIKITYTGTWTTTPSVGDTLVIPNSGPIQGGSDENLGGYIVVAATSNTITARKLSDAGAGGAVVGTVTAPVAVSSAAVVATTDFTVYAPVAITLEAGAVSDGLGKTLEINALPIGTATSTDILTHCAYTVVGTSASACTWVSTSTAPAVINATAEYKVDLQVNRQVDGISETLTAGGDVGLKVGYLGTTASVVVTDSSMTFTASGGSGASFTISDATVYPTINDLCAFINTKTGWTAAPGFATFGSIAPSALDNGTYNCGSTFGAATGRIKVDAYRFFNAVSGSALVQLGNPAAQVSAGLPATNSSYVFLTGGSLGSTTNTIITSALTAAEQVKCNFVIPLFSRDASVDIGDGLTDSSSTYTIDSIHAAVRTHVLAMSQVKRKRDRLALLSYKGTYSDSKAKAGNMASALVYMLFQDMKDVNSAGSVYQFQPWMSAVKAAAMQAAGGYKALVNKGINCSGALQAAGDWKDSIEGNLEDALLAGLMPIKRRDDGRWVWVSDQSTYGADNNFAYNSLQLMYAIHQIKATLTSKMERAFLGQSTADISAGLALAGFQATLDSLRYAKLLAASSDAPAGYKDAKVVVNGTTLFFSVEVKPSNAFYFIRIGFTVSQVTGSAG
jgi:hypothetical protein